MKLSVTLTHTAVGRQLRLAGVVVAALLAAISIAACGGSSKSSSTSSSTTAGASKSGSGTKFAACLKQHGVTVKLASTAGTAPSGKTPTGTVPSDGGGFTGTGTAPSGATPTGTITGKKITGAPHGSRGGAFAKKSSAKDEAAFKACAKYETKMSGYFGRGGYSAASRAGRATYSTATLTKFVTCVRKNGYPEMPNASKQSNGGFFSKSIEKNKKFQAAAKKCESILRPSGAAPGASTGTSTSAAS